MWTPDPPGRITPGGVLAVLGVAGLVWYVLQPQDQREALLCRPLSSLVQWLTADDAAENLWAQKITAVVTRFSERCPQTLDTRAAALAKRARTSASQVLTRAKTVAYRQIEEVTGPDRLRIAGLGETRLLGVTVPAEHHEEAITYLEQAIAGKRLAVSVSAAQDPERRPLVVVRLPDGTSVSAAIIQRGLAHPWKRPGPWQSWAVTGSSASNQ